MKKVLTMLMAIMMVFGLFIVAEAAEGAYAYSSAWKLEVASERDNGASLNKAFDGNDKTYYHSWFQSKDGVTEKDACPHTITVTFDKALEISSITYLPRQINGNDKSESGIWKKAEIHGSTDGKTFKKLCDATYDVAKTRAITKTDIPKGSYKAIKFVVTDTVNGYNTIGEIQFIGGGAGASASTSTTTTTSSATAVTSTAVVNNGWKIEASSAFGTGNAIEKAFDGKKETYWHSNYVVKDGAVAEKAQCPHTITVTFDKATEITAVTYLPRQIQGNDKSESGIWKKAEIHGSTDGKNFTKLKDATYDVIKSRALTTTEIPKGNYKAIKIVVTDSQGGYGTAAEITFISGNASAVTTPATKEETKTEIKETTTYTEDKVTNVPAGGKYSSDAYTYNSKWDTTVSSVFGAGSSRNMFDGDKETFWHSWYKVVDGKIAEKAVAPHTVTILFDEELPVAGLRYFPRTITSTSTSGIVLAADVYVTTDGKNFTKVSSGKFSYAQGYTEREAQEIKFDSVKVKGVKFVMTETVSGYGTCAELEIIKGEGAETTVAELEKASKKNNKFITMQIDSLDAKIGDKAVKLVKAPQIVDGRTLVPVRFVSESLGAVVGWDGEKREVSIMDGTNVIILEIDSPYVEVNGKVGTLDVPAQIIDGSTMVPIRFVSETLGANVAWDGETRTVTIDTPMTIACWGDSLTAGDGAQGTPYPLVLGNLTGLKTYNLGIGGETALTIAARQGAYDIALSEDFVIPESGSVDLPLVKFSNGTFLTTPDGGQVCPRATGAKWNPCYINGVEGKLSLEVDTTVVPRVLKKATFTRTTKGDAVEVKKGDLLIPSANYVKADINVIYIGANGLWDEDNSGAKNNKEQADKLINMIWKMIENTPDPEKFIVVGFTWGDVNYWNVVDAEMEKAFGDKFVATKHYLASEEALKDAGLTPTEADLSYIKNGQVPESLRKDGTHLNGKGYTLLATKIYERIIELGYIEK